MGESTQSTSVLERIQLEALVSIKAYIPEDAMTASLLGTERTGHGVRIRDDGLIVTIGYLINEAEDIWVTTEDGLSSAAFVVERRARAGCPLVQS